MRFIDKEEKPKPKKTSRRSMSEDEETAQELKDWKQLGKVQESLLEDEGEEREISRMEDEEEFHGMEIERLINNG